MKAFRLLFLYLFFSTLLSAQNWEGGIFLGGSSYLGDLVETNTPDFGETNIGVGLLIRNHINNKLAVRTNLTLARITGDDKNFTSRVNRGFNFKSSLSEVSLILEWAPFAKARFNSDGSFRKGITPYIYGGMGAAFIKPEVNFNQNDAPASLQTRIQADKDAKIPKAIFAFPLGGGLKFNLNKSWGMGLDLGVRPTQSDYLDGISLSANPKKKDWYLLGGLTISGRFGKADEKEVLPNITDLNSEKPLDSDNDGVADIDDKCPTEKGSVAFNGCPDTDNDGIADNEDKCPKMAGSLTLGGCPDSDSDGVADNEDNCPDVAGLAIMGGCPDSDNDGVVDSEDKCPNEAGVNTNDGCPEVVIQTPPAATTTTTTTTTDPVYTPTPSSSAATYTDNTNTTSSSSNYGQASIVTTSGAPVTKVEVIELLELAKEKVKFKTSSASINEESFPILDQIADLMNYHPNYHLTIDGYTDNSGDTATNQHLSMRRARRCYKYLASRGIALNRMDFKGHGESNPVASNSSEYGRQLNRRVEFRMTIQ
ncbi:MAG TPA: OmpA family protein [Saprospiraceae bacterium]|nr:OmpA family protein [Saprospiraceae bacterium]